MGANASVFSPWTAAFVGRLRELGWIEGRTIAIDYRWSEGRPERNAEIAAEFVRLNVDVIVTLGSAVAALKRVTSDIPIVFALSTDPVGGGLVDHRGGLRGINACRHAGQVVSLKRAIVCVRSEDRHIGDAVADMKVERTIPQLIDLPDHTVAQDERWPAGRSLRVEVPPD
jgi:hypothetical protein